ncbi:unnamed protein product [Prunus armeniaca]
MKSKKKIGVVVAIDIGKEIEIEIEIDTEEVEIETGGKGEGKSMIEMRGIEIHIIMLMVTTGEGVQIDTISIREMGMKTMEMLRKMVMIGEVIGIGRMARTIQMSPNCIRFIRAGF